MTDSGRATTARAVITGIWVDETARPQSSVRTDRLRFDVEWVAGKDGKPGPTGKPFFAFSNNDIKRDENRAGNKTDSVEAPADPSGPLLTTAVRKQKPPPLPKFKEVAPR